MAQTKSRSKSLPGRVGEVRDNVGRIGKNARARSDRAVKSGRRAIQRRPITSVGAGVAAGAAVGLVAGALVASRMANRNGDNEETELDEEEFEAD
jgi:ElaB/YqjD/DUF883 family membrane-anchored ribosome-binding protein